MLTGKRLQDIITEETWCQGSSFRDLFGRECNIDAAAKCCLSGANALCPGRHDAEYILKACHELAPWAKQFYHVAKINDDPRMTPQLAVAIARRADELYEQETKAP